VTVDPAEAPEETAPPLQITAASAPPIITEEPDFWSIVFWFGGIPDGYELASHPEATA
jgi:hypothetical protein